MSARIPAEEAFTYYVGLGPERSYGTVAKRFSVTKRAITKLAQRESWQSRLVAIEQEAQTRSDEKLAETLEQMNDRHLKMVRAMQAKALAALKAMPLGSAMDGVRALNLAIEKERLIRGEPTDRSALSVEETIKREYEAWLTPEEVTDGGR